MSFLPLASILDVKVDIKWLRAPHNHFKGVLFQLLETNISLFLVHRSCAFFFFFFYFALSLCFFFFNLLWRKILVFSNWTKILLKMVMCSARDHLLSTLMVKRDGRGKMKRGE